MSDLIPADDDLTPVAPPDDELTPVDPVQSVSPGLGSHEGQAGYSTSDGIPLDELPANPRRLSDPYAGQRAQYEAEQRQREEIIRTGFDFVKDPGLTEGQVNLRIAKHFGIREDVVQQNRDQWLKDYAVAKADPKAWIRDYPLSARLVLDHPERLNEVVNNKPVNVLMQAINKATDIFEDVTDNPTVQVLTTLATAGAYGPHDEAPPVGSPEEAAQYAATQKQRVDERSKRDAPRAVTEVDDAEAARIRNEGILAVTAQRAKEAQRDLDKSKLYHRLLVARTTGAPTFWIEQDIHRAQMDATPKYLGEEGWKQALAESVANSMSTLDVATTAVKKGGTGAAIGGAAGFIAGGLARNPAAATALATAGANALGRFGAGVGAAEGSFALESGSSYEEFMNLRTNTGEALTDEEARGGAIIAASLKTGIELAELSVLLKAMGPAGRVISTGGLAAVREALANKPAFRAMAVRALHAWGAEGLEEVSQDAVDQVMGYGLKSKHAGAAQPGPVLDVQRLKENFVGGLEGGAIFGMGGMAFTAAQHSMFRERQERGGITAEAIAKLAADPASQGLASELSEQIRAKTAETGQPVTHVYLDPKAFLRFFQGDEVKANEKATELMGPEGPRVMAEGLATGQLMPVQLEMFVEHGGKDDLAKTLSKDVALQASHQTPTQLEEGKKANEEWAQRIADGEEKSDTLERFDAVEAELAATGTHSPSEAKAAVAPLREVFLGFAKKFGQTAEDLFRGVRVQVDDGTKLLQVLRKQANVSERLSAELFDSNDGKGLANEERARRLYVDPVSGLRTRRGWNETPRTPGRLIAAVTSPDVKAFNDNVEGGHDTTNELLRTIGREVGSVDPNAARGGTNFLFEVDSPEHLNVVLERLRAALPDGSLLLEGAVGQDTKAALDALDAQVTEKRRTAPVLDEKTKAEVKPAKKADLPQRGETKFDLSKLKDLKFAPGKAAERLTPELVSKAGLMSKADFFREAYQDTLVPGILSGTAWNLTPRKAHVASIDIKGLKDINALGKDVGDRILKLFAQVAERNDASDFDFAHLSGDEFAAQHDDPMKLKAWLDHVEAELQKTPLPFTINLDGVTVTKPIFARFRSGIGEKTYGAADRALNKAKRLEQEAAAVRDGEDAAGGRRDVAARDDRVREGASGGEVQPAAGKGYERHGAARQGFIDREKVADPQRFEQFPTPEESLRAAQAFATFLDAAREQGAKAVEPAAEFPTYRATEPFSATLRWARSAGVDDPIRMIARLGLEGADGSTALARLKKLSAADVQAIHDGVLVERADHPESAKSVDTSLEVAGGAEKLATMLRGVLVAEYENSDRNVRKHDMFGGAQHDFDRDLAIELDNDPRTAGPDAARVPNSRKGFKALPGQKEIEEYLNHVNASKNRLFQKPSAEQQKAIDLAEDIRTALNKTGVQRLFATDDSGKAKGFTDIAREGIDAVYRIALTKNADKSTFLHESAHVFLDLFAELATRADAPKSVIEDWNTTLKWLGVDNFGQVRREHHEKWAKAFETYLAEGKYPADRLAGAFQRFRLWMMSVYKAVSNVGGEVSPDIRGVFDRLLATDAEIEATRTRMGLKALPQEVLGMDPEEYAAHLDELQRATSHAAQSADFQVAKDQLRATEDWWKAAKADEKRKASERYEALPARQAQLLLQGKPAGGFLGIKVPLNRTVVEAMVGKKLGAKFNLVRDGVHPDEVVEGYGYAMGFATGRDMLRAVLQLPEKAEWVEAVAQEAMDTQHPGILQERERLRDLVGQGLHGKATKDWLLKEYAALNARAPQSPGEMPPAEVLKRAAAIMAAGRTPGQMLPRAAQVAERTAANNAATAAAKGNFAQAAVFKRQQLLNMYLHDALLAAKKEVEQIAAKAAQLAKLPARQRLGKADPKYRVAVDALLATFDFAEPEQDAQLTNLDAALQEVEKLMAEDQTPVAFDRGRLVDRAATRGLRTWRELPMEDVRHIMAALQNIEAAARNRGTVLLDEKRADTEEVAQQLRREAETLEKRPDDPTPEAATVAQGLDRRWNAFDGALLKPEFLARILSGSKATEDFIKSMWFRAIVEPMQKAKVKEQDLSREFLGPLVERMDELPASTQSLQMEKVDGRKLFPNHPDLELPQRRFEILMMLLNMGNQSNIDRLTKGRNITEGEVMHAAQVVGVTKEEWDWVQSVWDTAEKLKPLAFDLEEKNTGVRPDSIVARPLETPFGVLPGGYFPAVYSPRSTTGARQEAQLAQFKDPDVARPSTTRNFLKSRVEDFSDLVSLSPSSINRHFALVIHDIAFREAVQSVGGLLSREDVRQTLRERVGDGRGKQLLQWVGDVAQMRGLEGMDKSGGLMRLATAMRGNLITATLGYKLPNALEDFTSNLLSAVPASDLKPRHLTAGIAEFVSGGPSARAMALEKSGELRARQKQTQRELAKQVQNLHTTKLGRALSHGPLGWYKDHAFAFAEAVEVATATPIWLGAYRQALAGEKTEAEAVSFADATLRQVLVSHSTVDLSALMRDKGPIGYLTMFMGAFNHFYNQFRLLGHDVAQADTVKDRAVKAGKMAGLATGLFLVGSLARGHGPKADEDPEDWLLRKMFLEGLMQMVPGANMVGSAMSQHLQGKRVTQRNNSLYGLAEGMTDSVLKLAEGKGNARDILNLLGPVTGQPLSGPVASYDLLDRLATWVLAGDPQ